MTTNNWPEKVYGYLSTIWNSKDEPDGTCQQYGENPQRLMGGEVKREVEYIRADIVAAKEKELLSKISDLEILLDNCRVGAVMKEGV